MRHPWRRSNANKGITRTEYESPYARMVIGRKIETSPSDSLWL